VFLGDRYILLHPLVRQELKLDEGTRERLDYQVIEFKKAYGRAGSRFEHERRLEEDQKKHPFLRGLRHSYSELRNNEQEAAKEEFYRQLKRTLTEEHFRRLDQLGMQERGASAFKDKDIIERLCISRTQVREIEEIFRSQGRGITNNPRTTPEKEESVRLYGEIYDAILSKVLTDQQQRSWLEMVGEPLSPPFGKTPYIVLAEY
jgi:hypothetical protein